MSNKQTYVASAFPLIPLTFLVLLTLKLTGLAQITWFWVFAPFWIGFLAFFIIIFLVFGTIAALCPKGK